MTKGGGDVQEKARASENGGPPSTSGNKTTEIPERIRDITGEMPQDQQRLLSQLYRISVQDPNMALMSFRELQAAADLYAVRVERRKQGLGEEGQLHPIPVGLEIMLVCVCNLDPSVSGV